jgi:hypothetical protein
VSGTGAISTAWQAYFTNHVKGETCQVVGFPRIFSEHAAGGGEGGSNPDHVLEIHPAIGMTCNGEQLDLLKNLKYVPGMKAITPASASACLELRKLYARQRGGTAEDPRYEFTEEGAKGSGGRCGNFIVVHARISKEYLRALTGGDHTALARVWVEENGPYPLKIYTYAGTPVDNKIAALMQEPDEDAAVELDLHGLVSYDYFTIIQTLQKQVGNAYEWRSKDELKEWVEVRHPLALVVFGRVQ